MKHFNLGLRILFGLHYFVFGINKIFVFHKMEAVNVLAQQVIDNFYATGYLMQAVGVVQLVSGLLMLLNKCFSLALIIAFPITLNIVLYLIFMNNLSASSISTGLLVLFANIYFLFLNRQKYYPMLKN